MGNARLSADLAMFDESPSTTSDITLTVPGGHTWRVYSVYVSFTTSATEAARGPLALLIADASDNVLQRYAATGVTQDGGRTYVYQWAAGFDNTQEVDANSVQYRRLAENLILPAGYKLRVYDPAAVDVTGDDLTVRLMISDMVE